MDIVTETEMREFFGRIITSIASLSEQAAQLETVRGELVQVQTRLNELSAENERLRKSEADAQQMASDADKAKAQAEAERNNAQSAVRHYKDVMVARDSRVAELEAQLKAVTDERDQAQVEANDLSVRLETVTNDLARTKEDLAHTSAERDQATAARDKAEASLNTIRSHLGIVSQDAHEEPAYPRAVGSIWNS